MSKKDNFHILIVTILDIGNYGNRLQNFALQQLLNSYGSCTTVDFPTYIYSFPRYLLYRLFAPIKRLVKFLLVSTNKNDSILSVKRNLECQRFTEKNVSCDLFHISIFSNLSWKDYHSIAKVVIGSDQVWNYRWLNAAELALRLGSFVPEKISVISYAASFGVSDVDDEEAKAVFQKYLPRLKAISVREDRGKELVKEMTGLEATVVLDPTLMLSTDQWNNITRGFVPDDDLYVLTYFLGKPSNKQEQDIQDYAKVHGCRVRRILDLRDKETYVAGPQDFVELFSKAQYVFTDSYHACCFSILYHKQFTVFNRAGMEGKANMNSRMETLFRLFDLDSVVMDKGLAPRIDYDKVDKLLARHRAESQAWLDKAMEA